MELSKEDFKARAYEYLSGEFTMPEQHNRFFMSCLGMFYHTEDYKYLEKIFDVLDLPDIKSDEAYEDENDNRYEHSKRIKDILNLEM